MLRGQLTSIEQYRSLISPIFRRNLSVAAVRYADDKDTSKVEGIFSWLKDVLRPDSRVEAECMIDRGATSSERHEINNTELKDITDQDFNDVYRSLKALKADETSTLRNPQNCPGDTSTSNLKTDAKTEKNVDTSLKQTSRSSFLNYDPLTLADKVRTQTRTIVSCAPRSTKPPIREPNMPEQQQKKDDKKDKKKKKPVIRMENEVSEKCRNEVTAECRNDLYDNLDVNFQWGIRLPEELEKEQQLESQPDWEVGLKRIENSSTDTNYSSYQVSSSQAMDAIRAIRDLQMTMSSMKDADKNADATGVTDSEKLDKTKENAIPVASKEAKEETRIESLKKILKTSPIVMKETSVVDEDYNVPANATFDAELAAWKDLVLKSKVPVDPTKEELVGTGTARRAELLSIRPEPPQPKLDVQAVPTADDSMKDDEDEVEFSRDVKSNATPMDVRRTSSPSDIHKMDSKKLHTGPFCCLRRHSGHGFNGRLRLNNPRILDSENDSIIVTSDFSTSTDGGWSGTERTPADGAEVAKKESLEADLQGNVASSQEVERTSDASSENMTANETTQEQQAQMVNFQQQEQPKLEAKFANSLDIPARDIDISLTRVLQESQDTLENSILSSTRRDVKKYESDEHVFPLPDDFQMNSDYAKAYEDDFYPSYESMALKHSEKPISDQNQEQSLRVEERSPIDENSKLFDKQAGQVLNAGEYATDSNYIKVPGDPYPYSKEHFNKWRMCQEQIHIGPIKDLEQGEIMNPSINSPPPPGRRVEIQPARKMSLDSHIRETPDDIHD